MAAGNRNMERTDPRHVEWVSAFGLGLQALAAVVALLVAFAVDGYAMRFLAAQAAAGILFWGVAWLHLRLRRVARDEAEETERAERRRQAAGLESLFDEPETGNAQRNLRQMEKYLVPVWSVAIAAVLALPVLYFLLRGTMPWTALADDAGMGASGALQCAFVALGAAFVLFLCGMYAAGLARARGCAVIRAGGGYMLSTAIGFAAAAAAMLLRGKEWGARWPEDIVAGALLLWMLLQACEIVVNLVLDIYRPRVAGVEARPPYDSRLSGLFAEPTGLFRTFAHTMDYQFGFKISETWFFHFLERAFMPLILVWVLTFYLLTCLVVVRPGEAVIIERFGVPLGHKTLPPTEDEAAWDRLPPVLGTGLHVKMPWPIDIARVLPRDSVGLLHAGFAAVSEEESRNKARELSGKVVSWDSEHIANENFYLMPMPVDMRGEDESGGEGAGEADGAPAASPAAAPVSDAAGGAAAGLWPEETAAQVDALFLSGGFSLIYRIGRENGDPYRYLYRTADPLLALRTLFEREITAHLAGARFWDVLSDRPGAAEAAILAGLKKEAAFYGIDVLSAQVFNLHPPAGDVGKSFQEVLAARQQRQIAVLKAEEEQKRILGMIPSRALAITSQAENDRYAQVARAKSEAELFRSRLSAYQAAPDVFVTRSRNEALMPALRNGRLIVHPPGVEIRLDDTKTQSAAEQQLFGRLINEINRENR